MNAVVYDSTADKLVTSFTDETIKSAPWGVLKLSFIRLLVEMPTVLFGMEMAQHFTLLEVMPTKYTPIHAVRPMM